VDAAVYDLAGRRVATLSQGDLPAGHHELFWDARDSSGARAAPGIYLVRALAGGAVGVRKVVLLVD
jgi:flagellar hook assembly protein FlgD